MWLTAERASLGARVASSIGMVAVVTCMLASASALALSVARDTVGWWAVGTLVANAVMLKCAMAEG
jgi:hypothetical protein